MTALSLRILVAGLALAGPAPGTGAQGAPPPRRDSVPASVGVDVPFVAQGPLLCGGAAAAMVERFWGARAVYAEDFAALVRPEEGGIRGEALAAALSRRGYATSVHMHEPSVLAAALGRGVPVIVLLDAGGRSLHYVVVVRLDGDHAWLHDPARGPSRPIDRAELARRWARADDWALVVGPGRAHHPDDGPRPAGATARHGAAAGASAEPGTPPEAIPPLLARGLAEARRGDYAAARRSALAAIGREGAPPLAWRLLATTSYLDGDRVGALRAWNHVEEPRLDLLVIDGLHRSRDPLVRRALGLRHDHVLTAGGFTRARRRLDDLPALVASRLDYRALPDGSAEATAHVLEAPRWPTGRLALASAATEAALDRRVTLAAGPFLEAGDRTALSAQWDPALAIARLTFSSLAPPLPGVAGVTVEWRRLRVGTAGGGVEVDERLHAGLDVRSWIAPSLRVDVGAGLDRWRGLGELGTATLGVHVALADDRASVTTLTEGWAGGAVTFGRASLRLRARLPRDSDHAWRLDAGLAAATRTTPPLAWWSAGAGRLGDVLLRGHPLARDGAVRGGAFGRGLAHASLEHLALWPLGPARVGAALFVDVARAWDTPTGTGTPTWVDVGAGLRAELGTRALRLDLARGGSWVLSAGIGTPLG